MEEFENALIELINANPLPFEAKWYIVRHVSGMVDAEYRKQKELFQQKPKESEVKTDE